MVESVSSRRERTQRGVGVTVPSRDRQRPRHAGSDGARRGAHAVVAAGAREGNPPQAVGRSPRP